MSIGVATAVAIDGAVARSALTTREREACARMLGTDQRRNYRAGRLAAKRAVQEVVGGPAQRRIEVRSCTDAPPALAILDEQGRPQEVELALSISHRDGRAVAVAAPGGLRVGVDLEPARAIPRRLARYFLSPKEHRHAKCDDVTVLWTLKEAVWKALGLRRALSLKELELCCGAGGALRGVQFRGAFVPMAARISTPWPGYVMATVWATGAAR